MISGTNKAYITCLLLLISLISSTEFICDENTGFHVNNNICKEEIGSFIKNNGQWDSSIEFISTLSFGKVLFYNSSFKIIIDNKICNIGENNYVEYHFINSISSTINGYNLISEYPIYIYKNDFFTYQHTEYERIKYNNVWNGVDIEFYFNNDGLKYDMILYNYYCMEQIEFKVDHPEEIYVTNNNIEYIINNRIIINDHLDKSYYSKSNEEININFINKNENSIKFVGDVENKDEEIVIDPLLFSSYYGGSEGDCGKCLDYNNNNEIIIAGETTSVDFTTPGSLNYSSNYSDIYVTKMSDNYSKILFSAIIGGNSWDNIADLKFDENGNIIIIGNSESSDFPITPNGHGKYNLSGWYKWDIIIVLLNNDGSSLLYSTYYGGNRTDYVSDMEYFNGDIVFTGHTNSDNFPVTQNCYDDTYNGYTDIFISRFNISNNSTIYSTFIGGPQSEVAKSLGIDDEGFIYLTGTCEENFPITAGSYDTTHNGENDAFVLKMDGNLSNLVFSTYIGGYSDDYGRCIKLDSDKNIVISGKTRSMNFPIVGNPAANKGDIFVLKLNNSGSKLLMSRYIPNIKTFYDTQLSGMVKNENGDFYIFGRTVSTDLETTESAIQNTNSGQWDGFLIMMDSDLNSTIYSTYYGGIDDDIIEDIYLLDNRELLMVGTTESINLPLTDNAIRRYLSGLGDIILSKLNISFSPSSPTNITFDVGDQYLNISWEEPTDDGGAKIDGYWLYKGETYISLSQYKKIETEKHYNDTELINGRRYFYRLMAYNIAGIGDFSQVFNATPITTQTQPIITDIVSEDRNVTITWESPIYDGGSTLSYYNVYRGYSPNELNVIDNVNPSENIYYDNQVINGIKYYYGISAVNDAGESSLSEILNTTPLSVPSPPLNVSEYSGNSFVFISWSPPSNNGGSPIAGYKIYKGTEKGKEKLLISISSDITYYNDTEVINGEFYYFYIKAVNIKGESIESENIKSMPMTIPSEPLDLSASPGDGFVQLHWLPPYDDGGISIDSYDIFRAIDGKEYGKIKTVSGEHTSFKDIDVTNGVAYRYRLTAINDRGSSEYSDEVRVTPIGVPHPPQDTVISTGDHFVQLLWEIPEYLGGDSHYSINIYKSENGDEPVQFTKLDEGVTKFNDTDVENGHTYRYQLSISNSRFTSLRSEILEAVPFALPGGVQNLQAVSGDRFIHISWIPPEDDGGFSITGYNIYRDGGEGMRFLMTVPEKTTEVNYSVINGNRFEFIVLAVTEIGESDHQCWVNATPRGPSWVPLNFTVEYEGGEIHFNWDEPLSDGGAPILKYRIYMETPYGHFELFRVISGQENSCILEGLDVGVYHFYISSENEFGESGGSYEIELTIAEERDEESHFILITSFLLILIGSIITISILIVRTKRRNLEYSEISQPMDDIISPEEVESGNPSPKVK